MGGLEVAESSVRSNVSFPKDKIVWTDPAKRQRCAAAGTSQRGGNAGRDERRKANGTYRGELIPEMPPEKAIITVLASVNLSSCVLGSTFKCPVFPLCPPTPFLSRRKLSTFDLILGETDLQSLNKTCLDPF